MNKYLSWTLFVLSILSVCLVIYTPVFDGYTPVIDGDFIGTFVGVFLFILLTFILWKNNFFKRND